MTNEKRRNLVDIFRQPDGYTLGVGYELLSESDDSYPRLQQTENVVDTFVFGENGSFHIVKELDHIGMLNTTEEPKYKLFKD